MGVIFDFNKIEKTLKKYQKTTKKNIKNGY